MCGIAGIIQRDRKVVDESLLQTMTDRIHHRGPDAAGLLG